MPPFDGSVGPEVRGVTGACEHRGGARGNLDAGARHRPSARPFRLLPGERVGRAREPRRWLRVKEDYEASEHPAHRLGRAAGPGRDGPGFVECCEVPGALSGRPRGSSGRAAPHAELLSRHDPALATVGGGRGGWGAGRRRFVGQTLRAARRRRRRRRRATAGSCSTAPRDT